MALDEAFRAVCSDGAASHRIEEMLHTNGCTPWAQWSLEHTESVPIQLQRHQAGGKPTLGVEPGSPRTFPWEVLRDPAARLGSVPYYLIIRKFEDLHPWVGDLPRAEGHGTCGGYPKSRWRKERPAAGIEVLKPKKRPNGERCRPSYVSSLFEF